MFELIILIVVAFAIYIVYTHASVKDANGVIVREQVIITPKSIGIEAMDIAGKTAGGSWTVAKRTISWSAERNALGEASLIASGWKETKGFTQGYDVAEQRTNEFIDSTWFTLDDNK